MSLIGDVKIQNTYSAEALSGTAKTATNSSIYTDSRLGQVVEEVKTQNTTKIDELLGKLATELQNENINIDVNEIKNSGLLFRVSGMKQAEIENTSDSELNKIFEALKGAIVATASNNIIDLEKIGDKANEYYIALNCKWDSISTYEAKKTNQDLAARIERYYSGPLNGRKFSELPKEEAEALVERYLNGHFNEVLIGKYGITASQAYDIQLRDFAALLNNTQNDEDKAIFKKAVNSLAANNKIKGLESVLSSFDTPEARAEWACWTVEEKKEFATKADILGNVISKEDAQLGFTKLAQVQSEDGLKKSQAELQQEAVKFFEENKEILERIAQKEANGEELTKEEKAIKLEKENFIEAAKAGEIVGTATNEIISTDAKAEILDKMNRDAYELPIYKEVMEGVKNIVEKNPELVTISKEEFTKILDEATNGNYSKVIKGETEALNAPYVEKTETANNTDNVGYKNAKTIDTTIVEAKKQEIINTTEPIEKIEIVKLNSKASEQATNNNFISTELKYSALRSAGNITQYLNVTGETKFDFAAEVFQKFSDASSTTKKWAMDYLTNASFAVQNLFLNKVSRFRSAMVVIAAAAPKEIDLTKFNLIGMTTTTEKQVEKIQEEKV